MIFNLKAQVIKNFEIIPGYWHLDLSALPIARSFFPGQFVEVKCGSGLTPLLRRPFSIYQADSKKGRVTLIYKIVGEGTAQLAQVKKGQHLEIMGPLGQSFQLQKKWRRIAVVAGGLGILPLFSLVKKARAKNPQMNFEIFWGAAAKSHFFCASEFRAIGVKIFFYATEDGSKGAKSFIPQIFKNHLAKGAEYDQIFACGPKEMLAKVAGISKKFQIPAQVSLEERMACGFGVCLSCAVKTRAGYKKVCDDGPVFRAEEIVW